MLGLKPIIWLITYYKCLINLLLSWKIYQVRNLKDSSLNLYIIMFYAITESRSSRGVNLTTLCDEICQRLAAGRWFSLGIRVFPINKTDRRDITEILLKVA